uniref:Secreted protein n=1 Tax=Phakopsora pachyrhizi TaxID=170000 RepID=A0A0S1MK68_PHAPC
MIELKQFTLLFVVSLMSASFSIVQLLPSHYNCNNVKSSRSPIIREDCRDSLNLFSSSNITLTFKNGYTQSCGTCRVTILKSKTLVPPSTAPKSWAVTALHQGYDHCNGNPVTATIGDGEKIDVLLAYGNGSTCAQ